MRYGGRGKTGISGVFHLLFLSCPKVYFWVLNFYCGMRINQGDTSFLLLCEQLESLGTCIEQEFYDNIIHTILVGIFFVIVRDKLKRTRKQVVNSIDKIKYE